MGLHNKRNSTCRAARAAVFALVAAALCVLVPRTALAAEYVASVQDTSGKTLGSYTSSSDAINAAYGNDKVLVMLKDWNLGTTQGIHGGKSLTIDMNGHRITGVDGASVLHLYEGATLKLKSSAKKDTFFFFDGFDNVSGNKTKVGLYSRGLVTGGQTVHGGGIYMEDRARLVLDNVAVAGNSCKETTFYNANGGGVYAEDDCTVDIQNNAKIQYNYSEQNGGGVSVHGERTAVNINGATICKNYAKHGGGLYSGTVQTHVNMKNKGSITENVASDSGGGMTFSLSYFFVESDGTGVISHNKTKAETGKSESSLGGGGIYVIGNSTNSNEGEIKGVKFEYNRSSHRAGALYLGQEWTKVISCTFTGNSAEKHGGAIYNNNDDNVISGCTFSENSSSMDGGAVYIDEPSGTITGCTFEKNHCEDEGGAVYVNDNLTVTDTTAKDNWCASEGGAFYVAYRYDVKMTGKCIIKGNTRGRDSGTKDDVFLNHLSGGGGKAYITGSLSTGSSVGVRTGYEDERRIAKSFKPESNDCLFIDPDGYYVSYGSDKDGDAWQRHTTKGFELKVNDESRGRYQNGTSVTANGTSANDSKVFKCWNSEKSTGFYPFSDYITDAKNPVATFKMPQNDVSLVATYVTRVSEVTLVANAPQAGKALPTTGKISWKDGNGVTHEKEVALTWLEKSGDKWVPASGEAGYGATYAAETSVDQDLDSDLAFALDIEASKQSAILGGQDAGVQSASVDALGRLSMRTKDVSTEKPAVESVEGASVTVQEGASEAEFRKLLPATAVARTNAGTAVKLEVDTDKGDLSALIEGGTVKMPEGGTATVRIPLKASSEVTLPSGTSVSVAVTVTAKPVTAPAAPTVSPDEGTYSTADDADSFTDGKLKVTARCETEGAKIRYRLDYCDDGWTDDTEAHDYSASTGIELAKRENDQRLYELEIWSVKDGLESEHAFCLYVVDDIRDVTVTVDRTDTGANPATERLEEHSVRKGASLTVVAPDRPGYAFEKWTVGGEDRAGATLTLDSVDEATTVTAVYNPVVSAIDIEMAAPAAHRPLGQAARTVKATVAGEETDLTGYFSNSHGSSNPDITWAPAGDEEGAAEHLTAYTASLELKESSVETGERYVIPSSAAVKCNGRAVSGGMAYVTESDGVKRVNIEFPETAGIANAKVDAPETIELTREEAWDCQTRQDAGNPASWGLPKEISVTSADEACGCTALLDVTWNKVTGFKMDDYGEQELTVTGTVDYPDYVAPADDSSKTVTAKIKVAAAEKVGALQASIPAGTYKGTQDVVFVCGTDDVTVRYTTDGSEPTEESPVYDGGWIEVVQSTSFKVKAFRDGWKPSETLSISYRIVHDVTFDAAGGSAVEAQEVEHGKRAARPADPVLAGCTFEGWYAEDAEDAYDFDTPVTADLELHARWSAKGEPVELHAVTFDSAGGTEVPGQHVAHGGVAAKPADPELEGFRFEGWLTAEGEEYDFTAKVTSDVALHASWSRGGEAVSAHTVTFDSAGGSAVDAQTVADGACAKEPAAPTLEGFDFEGWYAEGAEAAYDFSSRVTSDIALYARWSANGEAALAHLVVFDAAGGTAVPAQTVADGETVERPADPTRKGHEFQGWYAEDSKDAYDFGTRVTDDLILYARWSAKGDDGAVEHLVTFDSAGGTPVASQSVADGRRAERPADPTRAGYEFLGWTLDGEAYDFKTPVKTDLELKATWRKKASKREDQKGGGTKTVTTVTTSTDNNLAATGDRTLLIVGALIALGLLAAAVGVLAKRRNK